ncbi:alkaline phosphatase family protein [Mycobacterium yunnanensis]|uniref:Alkaline phosphatase family protein n=1 Tax=Mycobacterium yunnanensis TaxID=368477 RepID=A0A9X3BSM6_9MYCO|nr:nucleotide pyrophosphatase/phosphodiesterase family protein [Mycobacterium yunnanensis]MCV7420230.1 alkaline phosphatase family protein [Mycobacterium yunnanensis]
MDLPRPDPGLPHLADVAPSVLSALGGPEFDRRIPLRDGLAGACVLLVDGLGADLLDAHAADAPVLAGLRGQSLSVGFPSTTAAGLAAVGTGCRSGEHGMVGYSFRLGDSGVVNALQWRRHPGGEDLRDVQLPEQVQPLPTVFERAAASGFAVTVASNAQFAGTGLTRAVLRGGRFVGVHGLGDLAATIQHAVARGGFCYGYHGDLDLIGHLHGPGSVAWRLQLRQVDRLVESIVEGLPPGTLLAVVADHGMVAVGEDDRVDVDTTPELLDGVHAIGGEARARHVYAVDGAAGDVLAAWREVLGRRAWVVSRDEAIAAGWFGDRVTDRVADRIGDVVAAGRDSTALVRRTAEPVESGLVGHHGSLTTAEQRVPLLLAYG